jgi:hypothetical protein
MNTKAWFLSKTLWFNAVAILAIVIQLFNHYYIIPPEVQSGILAIINIILRTISGQPLEWKTSSDGSEEPPHFIPPNPAGFIQRPLILMLLSLALFGCLLNACSTTNPGVPADWIAPLFSNPALSAPVTTPVATTKDNPMQTAGKALLAVKSTIVTAATATDALCKAGKISADKCAQAKTAYEQAKPAYDAAVDSYLLMTSQGGDPGDFGRKLSLVQNLATNLLSLGGAH